MQQEIIKSIFIIIIAFIVSKLLPRILRLPHSLYEYGKTKMVFNFIKQTITLLVYFVAILLILNMYHIDITPYLLSSSIIGFAVAFGAQSFFKDIIAGINLILEPQLLIGKKVVVDKATGTLKKINLKNTYIETEKGDLYIIPNGEIKTIVVLKEKA